MLQPHVVKGRISILYRNYAGKVGSKFLVELRDNQRIMGMKCPECGIVYVPPKSVCPKCASKLQEWVEVSNIGTLQSYTIVDYVYSINHQPEGIPYAIGIIKLDGADTGLCHLLREIAPSELKVGLRVEAVFKEKREGNILDIRYFKPLQVIF